MRNRASSRAWASTFAAPLCRAHDVFVDGVIEHFLHQNVTAIVLMRAIANAPDVHARAEADVFERRECLDFALVINMLFFLFGLSKNGNRRADTRQHAANARRNIPHHERFGVATSHLYSIARPTKSICSESALRPVITSFFPVRVEAVVRMKGRASSSMTNGSVRCRPSRRSSIP